MTSSVPSVTAPSRPSTDSGPALRPGDDGVARLVLGAPGGGPVLLSLALLERLDLLLDEVERRAADGSLRALVVASVVPGCFVAGADAAEVRAASGPAEVAEMARRAQRVLLRLERLPVPTVAAIEGRCLGAGAELALACAHRVAADRPEVRIGFPEVRLGLLPALGGTVRLPRLLGPRAALELLLEGRSVGAREARDAGLVDAVLPAERFDERLRARIARWTRRGWPARRTRGFARRLVEETAPGRRLVFRQARRTLLDPDAETGPAARRILETVAAGTALPLDDAFELEARALGELSATPEARGLLHVSALRGTAGVTPVSGAPAPGSVAILGGGAMAGNLAHHLAARGIAVRLRDPRRSAVADAVRHAESALARSVPDERALREARGRIESGTGFGGFGLAEVVVEVLTGSADAKHAALLEAEAHVGGGCVVATTSLVLSVADARRGLSRPERVAGLHLFPSPATPLLAEVVRAPGTSDAAVGSLHALARRIGAVPVDVADVPGFLLPRLLVVYVDEAVRLLEEGAAVGAVDAVAEAWGMGAGPLRLADEVGLEALARAQRALHDAWPERVRAPDALEALVRRGFMGAGTGSGFHRHAARGAPVPDEGVPGLIRGGSDAAGEPPDGAAMRDRLSLALVNAAALTLGEGVVGSPGEVDLAAILGLGVPEERGGLLFHADREGAAAIVAALERLAERHGARFEPAPALREAARTGRRLYDV